MTRELHRVAIVNRGEAAMRFIHALREHNAERGTAIRAVALVTDPDRSALFAREADEVYELGSPTFVDARDGRPKSTYLDHALLARALRAVRADAAWVGWGFVAEDAAFADLCAELGVLYMGPGGDTMRQLGDKIAAKRLAQRCDVPVAPWSEGPVGSYDEVRAWAESIGYPILLKAAAGGGGRGIRRVRNAGELSGAYESSRAEALAAFGDGTVFVEKLLEGMRHVEVQILADHHGTVWPVGLRDCTLQRRHQKVLEEAPSPAVAPAAEQPIRAAAVRLARAAGYRSAGTVEFLLDPSSGRFWLMEVNTRLQVEHPVTELTTGLDLVKAQIRIACGERLEGSPPQTLGHCIEVRLNAEDPDHGFSPAPGTFARFRLPTGPGVRVDRGFTEGDRVAPEFDSMIAKIIAYGRDRTEALARLRRALSDTVVVLEGGTTNKAFLLELLGAADVRANRIDTTWIDRWMAERESCPRPYAAVALVQAAIEAYDAELGIERREFFGSAARMRPEARKAIGRSFDVRMAGAVYSIGVYRLGRGQYRVVLDGKRGDVQVERVGAYERRLSAGGRRYRVTVVVQGSQTRVEVEGVPHRVSRDDGGIVRAMSPALVVSLPVQTGDVVQPGATLAILEAMKMETAVVAPSAGRVREIFAIAGTQVGPGAPLLQLEPTGGAEEATGTGARADATEVLGAPSADARAQWLEVLSDLRRLVLGYDIPDEDAGRLPERYAAACAAAPLPAAERAPMEDALLAAFADIESLFRPARSSDDEPDVMRASEHMVTYLRSLDPKSARLPASFLARLGQTLSHYEVESMERSAAQEDALHCIYRAHGRAGVAAALAAVLERRLADPPGEAGASSAMRELLDRLIAVGEARHPAVADLAREIRDRDVHHPAVEQYHHTVYAEMDATLRALVRDPGVPDRAARIQQLVDCPLPLEGRYSALLPGADRVARETMLEVMLRRYYRIRELEAVDGEAVGDHSFVRARFDHDGGRFQVLATHTVQDAFDETLERVRQVVAAVAREQKVLLDVFVWRDGPLGAADDDSERFRAPLCAIAWPRPVHRVVVTLATPGAARGQQFTYRPAFTPSVAGESLADEPGARAGLVEDRDCRGFHPMVGKRLELWRLSAFDIERLPSPDGVYLFRGVARSNPKDERLFAFCEVRDLSPLLDERGRVVALPELERILGVAFGALRHVQARRAPGTRLHWNRVVVHVWPPVDLGLKEIVRIAERLRPTTQGLGLEKVAIFARVRDPETGELQDTVFGIRRPGGTGLAIDTAVPTKAPLRPLDEYTRKVVRMRQRGLVYPYEITAMLAAPGEPGHAELPPGRFVEHDLDAAQDLVPVDRPPGRNGANVVVGVVRTPTARVPEGVTRVVVLGDPSREMGSLAEPECRRILAALQLARRMNVPLEWFALSAGAKISMQSGTENMDWISRVLRDIVQFTQEGREINIVVVGVTVGAQPYWNAEATMLQHTRGILVMTADGAMVLTGKTALDYSGSVSAEDNFGIGGYERIMGPNGQAQYFARDVAEAVRILLRHYDHTYVVPGERFPRSVPSADPVERDVCQSPHSEGFATVGEVFAEATNPGRKKPFDIRSVMQAVIDRDQPPLERWRDMMDAETAVVWDGHLGGQPICLIGIESKPLQRLGFVPNDGPESWTSGTLFPLSSKKIARAIQSASGNRPLVMLANLSGFDGSPESMRKLQLEHGAEIGRAIVNFRGPIVFCVVSRYHGGAFVVFSKALNDGFEAVALEGSYASVIGGAPAAAVVFAREVADRVRVDPRVAAADRASSSAPDAERRALRQKLAAISREVHAEKLSEVADEFDAIHTVQRALKVGSLDRIIAPSTLRPYLVDAVRRGMARTLEREGR